ncbi:MAG: phytanoyl-CoA dioxygenase family protein [Alphaproteobacteria bacterium]|nr:phytanoyl-CoA dioxygenase family protein [Alphaproteobacteria bacterium]|tara:strand:+ start:187 stop:978 length:792 start_codon:yes stop_codon:yes gene_type:complete
MDLNKEQVCEYDEKGWIILPQLFSKEEVYILESAALDVLQRPGPEVARELNGDPHVCWGMHLFDERFAALTRHPSLLLPVEQLMRNQVFVHQSRINIKQQNGSIVEWHQDFGTYHRVDGIPEARGIMIGVFLDDVSACNAPVLAVPGSHKEGVVSEAVIDNTVKDHDGAAKYRYDITETTMQHLVEKRGIESIQGPAGSVLLMNMTVVHGSSVNISPLRRLLLYVNVSAIDNRGESFVRPEYYAARDFAPLVPLDPSCLLSYQ